MLSNSNAFFFVLSSLAQATWTYILMYMASLNSCNSMACFAWVITPIYGNSHWWTCTLHCQGQWHMSNVALFCVSPISSINLVIQPLFGKYGDNQIFPTVEISCKIFSNIFGAASVTTHLVWAIEITDHIFRFGEEYTVLLHKQVIVHFTQEEV